MCLTVWNSPPSLYGLEKHTIDIWRMNLEQPYSILQELELCLSSDELKRAYRFYFEKDQRKFIAARGSLRLLLARYLHCSPAEIKFEYQEKGKPFLNEPIEFNISHSGEMALIAITSTITLGVDIEYHRQIDNLSGLAKRVFSEDEFTLLQKVKPEDQMQSFFNGWTRKEAFIKAIGEGLFASLKEFSVTIQPNQPVEFTKVPDKHGGLTQWKLFSFKPEEGYTGALAVQTDKAIALNFYPLESIE